MKPTFTRRQRRRSSSSQETAMFKKDSQQEASFFTGPSQESFFPPTIQRKCEECEKEEKKAQRKEDKEEEKDKKLQKKENSSSVAGGVNVNSYVSTLSGKGQSLPSGVSNFFASRMGYDFSNVKVHHDSEAAASAKSINAQAYTIGDHIVFNQGKYNAETQEGKKLLAHELTHVMQQNDGSIRRLQMKAEDDTEGTEPVTEEMAAEEEATANEELANEPFSLPDITIFGKSSTDIVHGRSVRFEGETKANFDGGVGQTKNLKAVKAKTCDGCTGTECLTITGTFEITYTVTTSVMLPNVPEGLTPCQHDRVKNAIDTVLAPHEQEHVKAYDAYNGKVQLPINYTGCKIGLESYLQGLNDSDGLARKARVKAKSDALDPFFVDVDLDCKEPEPPKK